MDELVIGDKKYISSKLAAKATGYAKDYVGQLCREGRVPARLVGRSWYVLESAIQDHRFGEPKDTPSSAATSASSSLSSTWEAPRYEASETEVLPSMNRLHESESPELAGGRNENAEVAERLQETWQAWFDRFDRPADVKETGLAELAEPKIEQKEVNIPIHAVYQPRYQPPPEELLPRRLEEPLNERKQRVQKEEKRGKRPVMGIMQLAGALIALFLATTAILGSGYLDTYIVSVSQVRIIAGVSLYNK